MSSLVPLRMSCEWVHYGVGCPNEATTQLVSVNNVTLGRYCAMHGEASLEDAKRLDRVVSDGKREEEGRRMKTR